MQLGKFIQHLQECTHKEAEVTQVHIEKDMFRVTLKTEESTVIITNMKNADKEG